MDFSWMAWTRPTATFFAVIAVLLISMGVWERFSPGGAPRKGLLGVVTHRGDRLFITLLGSAFIHLGWIAATGANLWFATAISAVYALLVFRFI